MARQTTSPVVETRYAILLYSHGSAGPEVSRRQQIRLSLVFKEVEELLKDRVIAPTKFSPAEVLVIVQDSLSQVAGAQECLPCKILGVIQVLAEVQILNKVRSVSPGAVIGSLES